MRRLLVPLEGPSPPADLLEKYVAGPVAGWRQIYIAKCPICGQHNMFPLKGKKPARVKNESHCDHLTSVRSSKGQLHAVFVER